MYQKLINNLSSPDLILRQKAVAALIQLFDQKTDHVARTVEYGGIPALVRALKDEDEWVRVSVCVALTKVVGHPRGQQYVLDEKLEMDLKQAVHDEPSVAVEALRTLQALDAHWNDRAGTRALIRCGCIELYIQMAGEGVDEVKAEALKALAKVYNVKEAFIQVFGVYIRQPAPRGLQVAVLSSGTSVPLCDKWWPGTSRPCITAPASDASGCTLRPRSWEGLHVRPPPIDTRHLSNKSRPHRTQKALNTGYYTTTNLPLCYTPGLYLVGHTLQGSASQWCMHSPQRRRVGPVHPVG